MDGSCLFPSRVASIRSAYGVHKHIKLGTKLRVTDSAIGKIKEKIVILQCCIKGDQVFWKEETLGNTLCILGNQIVNISPWINTDCWGFNNYQLLDYWVYEILMWNTIYLYSQFIEFNIQVLHTHSKCRYSNSALWNNYVWLLQIWIASLGFSYWLRYLYWPIHWITGYWSQLYTIKVYIYALPLR